MASGVNPRRRYDSSRRKEQARATRRAVLSAARELFVQQGYVATTIEAIAADAGVAPETVYMAFKNKRSLLNELLDVSITGDDAPVAVLDRSWVDEMSKARTVTARLQILARNGRLILERLTPLYEVLRGAAAADEEVAALWDRYKAERFAGQTQLVRVLANGRRLRTGMTLEEAADILFTVGSPETYSLLTRDRGWSPDRFERWYAATLKRLLFAG